MQDAHKLLWKNTEKVLANEADTDYKCFKSVKSEKGATKTIRR